MEVNTFQNRETLFKALHSTTHSGINVMELHLDLGSNRVFSSRSLHSKYALSLVSGTSRPTV